jgi:hypothetical protein
LFCGAGIAEKLSAFLGDWIQVLVSNRFTVLAPCDGALLGAAKHLLFSDSFPTSSILFSLFWFSVLQMFTEIRPPECLAALTLFIISWYSFKATALFPFCLWSPSPLLQLFRRYSGSSHRAAFRTLRDRLFAAGTVALLAVQCLFWSPFPASGCTGFAFYLDAWLLNIADLVAPVWWDLFSVTTFK